MKTSIQRTNGLHSISEGTGAPIILLHGLGGSLDEWSSASSALVQSGYQTHRVDLPGHGFSDKSSSLSEYQSSSVYNRIESWFLQLELSEEVAIIGHSYGGYLAVNLAYNYPESITSLILVSPFFYKNQLLPVMRMTTRRPEVASRILELTPQSAIEKVVQMISSINNHLPNGTVHQMASDLSRASPKIVHIAPTIKDMRSTIAEIDVPTLMVWGNRDLTLNPNEFRPLQRSIPNSVGTAFDRCGHTPHLSEADVFHEMVLDFIQEESVN
jgi:pimeloyl-ACP methyl ester carboxylesterase